MVHPHLTGLKDLTDTEIEERIFKLNRYYHITPNPDVRQQMILVLDELKLEMEARMASKKLQNQQDDDENGLDNLINVS